MEFLRHAWEFCNFQYVKFNVVYCVRIPAADDRMGCLRENERKERRMQRREREKEIPNWVDYFWCCICMLCSFTFFGCFGRFAKKRKDIVHVHIISLHCLELILTARITVDRSFSPSLSSSTTTVYIHIALTGKIYLKSDRNTATKFRNYNA